MAYSLNKNLKMTIRKIKLFTTNIPLPQELKYYVYLPENYEKLKLPLVLFLHGAGERGEDLTLIEIHGCLSLLKKVKIFLLL